MDEPAPELHGRPSPIADGAPAVPSAPDPDRTPTRGTPRRPPSINTVSAILIVFGGAMEGYAVAQTFGDAVGRDTSLMWAFLGAALVVTAWALRERRWWGAAAAIGVSLVGLVAGMLGVYGVLLILSSPSDDRSTWPATLGLVAIGAGSIAVIGLLSGAWTWLTAAPTRSSASSPTAPA